MESEYCVIIIGAGPAGSACAKELIKNGINTVILEKKTLPRIKCCSGLLSERAEDILKSEYGDIPEDIFCNEKEIGIKICKRNNLFFEIPGIKSASIRRDKFDYWLFRSSKSEIIENALVIDLNIDKDFIEVKYLKDNKESFLKCAFLVGADGGNSFVRRKIDDDFKKEYFICSLQNGYKFNGDIDKKNIYFLKNKQFGDFYGWFNIKDDLLYAGTTYFLNNLRNNYLNNITDILKNEYKAKLQFVRKEACIMDGRLNDKRYFFGEKNILLAGESCGLLDIMGEGIASALISGKIAAQSIISAKKNNNDAIDIYLKDISEEKKYLLSHVGKM